MSLPALLVPIVVSGLGQGLMVGNRTKFWSATGAERHVKAGGPCEPFMRQAGGRGSANSPPGGVGVARGIVRSAAWSERPNYTGRLSDVVRVPGRNGKVCGMSPGRVVFRSEHPKSHPRSLILCWMLFVGSAQRGVCPVDEGRFAGLAPCQDSNSCLVAGLEGFVRRGFSTARLV